LVAGSVLALSATATATAQTRTTRRQSTPSIPIRPAWFDGDLEAALATAKARNCPIVVVLIQDGEEANDRVVNGIHANPAFIKALERTVALICNQGTGHETRIEDGATVCAKHGSVACERHQKLARETFQLAAVGGLVATPQMLTVDQAGNVLERVIDVPALDAFVNAIDSAVRKLGPGLTDAEYQQVSELLNAVDRAAQQANPAQTLAPLQDWLERKLASSLAERLTNARTRLEKELNHRMAIAATDGEAGRVYEALRMATFISQEAPQTSAGKQARTLLGELGKRPEARDAKKLIDAELRALQTLEKAEQAVAKGDGKRALREAEQALRLAAGSLSFAEVQARVEALRARTQ
jgi:hypothetical protein